MKTNLFIFSSKESYKKYYPYLEGVRTYGFSAEVLNLFEPGKKSEDIKIDKYLLIFSDKKIEALNGDPKFRLLEKLTMSKDVIEEIDQSCLK